MEKEELWNDGILDYWKNRNLHYTIASFQYSNIPLSSTQINYKRL